MPTLDDKKQLVVFTPSQLRNINRRKKYRFNLSLGMSKVNAAIMAKYPKKLVDKLSEGPVPADYENLFEKVGMTNKQKVGKILQGMEANKLIITKAGDEIEVPDWSARHKYLETMLKLCKHLDKDVTNTNNFVINIAQRLKEARERQYRIIDVKAVEREDEIDPKRIEALLEAKR